MKVNHPAVDAYVRSARVSGPTPVDKTAATPKPVPQVSPVSNDAANVTFSPEARALAAGIAHGVDTAKVERLREQVASGKFQVDSQKVAQRMLDVTG